jgi:hypothetical protein
MRSQGPNESLEQTWTYYNDAFALLASEVIAKVRDLGVTVVQRVTSVTLGALLREYPLVGLIAHHPLQPLLPGELADPGRLLAEVIGATDEPTVLLRELLVASRPDLRTLNAESLALLLNGILEASDPYYGVFSEERRRSFGPTDFAFSRVWLEQRFGTLIRPGPCIELWGEFLGLEQLAKIFPPNYAGAMDLMVCNSVLHADVLKRRYPLATFAVNAALARVAARLVRFSSMATALHRYGRADVKDLLQAAMAAGTAI